MKYISIILLAFLFLSCEDVIGWDVDSDQIKLVVEGRVTNELKQHQIKLTETADYFNASPPNPVEGAQVLVNDGIDIYAFQEVSPGVYESQAVFEGVPGRTYSLSIELQRPLGTSSFYVASSTMAPPMQMDSLFSQKTRASDDSGQLLEDSVFNIGFYGQEVEGVDNSYLFDVYNGDFLETNTIVNAGYFDDEFIEDEYFEDFLIYEMDVAKEGDSITVLMYTIEDAYLEFIEALVIENEGSEPLGLSGPPANVIGNISSGGLGYFYAAAVDTMSTILE